MKCKQMWDRAKLIFSEEYLGKVHIKEGSNGEVEVEVDLHHLHCNEAKKFITNIITLFRGAFKLVLIHGYNHGTALRDMIRNDYHNNKIQGMYFLNNNPGVTILQIA